MIFRSLLYLLFVIAMARMSEAGNGEFVSRSGGQLVLDNRPFSFLGTNAYYLLTLASRGDTAGVREVLGDAADMGMKVIRTWAFNDGGNAADPSVIQYTPGRYNEIALRALDYVVFQAKQFNLRVLFSLVGNWDDFGGMNQYVRWRSQLPFSVPERVKYSDRDMSTTIFGTMANSYHVALSPTWGHDDFYSDSTIKQWYKGYVENLVDRVNVYTGITYGNEPSIFGWELANEPRSSDRTGALVASWLSEMSLWLKSIDGNHLVGSGEEGFDVVSNRYSLTYYDDQTWLFDGTGGSSFTSNVEIPSLDFAGIHLYPDFWNLRSGSGNAWIRDHARISAAAAKPLIVGEFGSVRNKASTYRSWLTTALLDGSSGAIHWQLLPHNRADTDALGVWCPNDAEVCSVLRESATSFDNRPAGGYQDDTRAFFLQPNYPNPFNSQTIIEYTLSDESYVTIEVWNAVGQRVKILFEGIQNPGTRREIFNADGLASGVYLCSVSVLVRAANGFRNVSATRPMLHLR